MNPVKLIIQTDYAHIKYVSPVSPQGTIADNGCGVCAACMLIEALLGEDFSVEDCARFAISSGARERSGTDFYILSRALAARFGLNVTETEDAERALEFLSAGEGIVIANVRGDREGYTGVFSDCGHYILLSGARGREVTVFDPMYAPGRYDSPGRAGKVRMEGYAAIADMATIAEDCMGRPYFLFSVPSDKNTDMPANQTRKTGV